MRECLCGLCTSVFMLVQWEELSTLVTSHTCKPLHCHRVHVPSGLYVMHAYDDCCANSEPWQVVELVAQQSDTSITGLAAKQLLIKALLLASNQWNSDAH